MSRIIFGGMKKKILVAILLLCNQAGFTQIKTDSTVKIANNYIALSEIVVNSKLDVPSFIERVKNDTTFYKAFRNLRVIGYTSLNDIRMVNKDGDLEASLASKTKQIRSADCRSMQVLDQKTTGNMVDQEGNFNYYTAEMYAGLFFTKGSICGETNIVNGFQFSTAGLSGIDKHKEQLKMLFFNPGKKISGLPFISDKTAIFDASMADKYDMSIDYGSYNQIDCYIFSVKAKADRKSDVVIDEMTTWFNEKTFEIVARNYSISYDAGVYDFNVKIAIEMTKAGDLLVPNLLRYNGDWKVVFKKREHGIFTATLFDFVR
jgi:hypothetical protein